MRSHEFPKGLPDLDSRKQQKVDDGNALAGTAVKLVEAQAAAKGYWQWEQPDTSLMWEYMPVKTAIKDAFLAIRDVCMDGAPWKKPTRLAGNHACVEGLHLRCCGGHAHQPLEGCAPCGSNWTALASPYWPAFAARMAEAWKHLLQPHHQHLPTTASYRSAPLTERADMSIDAALERAQLQPSGKRSRQTIGSQVGQADSPGAVLCLSSTQICLDLKHTCL